MALLVDYSQTRYGIPYANAYLRVTHVAFHRPTLKEDGTPADAFVYVSYHVFASAEAASAEADPLYVGHVTLPFAVTDNVSFASVYAGMKSQFENARDA